MSTQHYRGERAACAIAELTNICNHLTIAHIDLEAAEYPNRADRDRLVAIKHELIQMGLRVGHHIEPT